MAAMQDLVEEVERSFAETQERLSDPSVYNDHREAAEVGRRLKELEAAHKLATEWLEASSDLEAARVTATCASWCRSSRNGSTGSSRS